MFKICKMEKRFSSVWSCEEVSSKEKFGSFFPHILQYISLSLRTPLNVGSWWNRCTHTQTYREPYLYSRSCIHTHTDKVLLFFSISLPFLQGNCQGYMWKIVKSDSNCAPVHITLHESRCMWRATTTKNCILRGEL